MAYNQEEQEQLDTIKAWWGQYGNLILMALAAAALAFAAFQGWRYYQHQRAVAAATLYEQLDRARRDNDAKKVRDIAAQITDKHGATPYAALAALAAARAAYGSGEVADAKTRLQWVIDSGKQTEMQDVARLRLAGILLDEKKFDEALKLLDIQPGDSFAGLYANLRGDILYAQGKLAEARAAYQLAFDKSDTGSQYRNMLQVKLDALGEVK